MTLLLLLSLLATAPGFAEPAYCAEVREVMLEAVERGVLTYKEANELLASCASASDFEPLTP